MPKYMQVESYFEDFVIRNTMIQMNRETDSWFKRWSFEYLNHVLLEADVTRNIFCTEMLCAHRAIWFGVYETKVCQAKL